MKGVRCPLVHYRPVGEIDRSVACAVERDLPWAAGHERVFVAGVLVTLDGAMSGIINEASPLPHEHLGQLPA